MPVSTTGWPRKRSTSLCSPETTNCSADNYARFSDKVVTRAATPGKIVGEVILMKPVAAQSKLRIGFEVEAMIAQRGLGTHDRIVRSRCRESGHPREFRFPAHQGCLLRGTLP